jgi:S-adenosylmethionine/arginine decarboxylase-like enzyme
MAKNVWGFHLALDIAKCNPKLISCPKHITAFSNDLVKRIDMVKYGEPQVVHFGTGNKAGYTLVQLIETSNICAHFCEEDNAVFLDVFSCKPYRVEDVITCVKEYFEPHHMVRHYLKRSIPELQ